MKDGQEMQGELLEELETLRRRVAELEYDLLTLLGVSTIALAR